MIWIVLRFGVHGAIVTNVVVQISMVVSLALAGHETVDVTLFQALLLVLASSSLILGLAVDQSRISTQQLRADDNKLAASLKISATGELAGALAHELGHPLGAISNYAAALNHVIARVAPDDAEGRSISGKLSREIVRATDTLHRLRDFFRTGSLSVERVNIAGLVKEALSMLNDRFENSHIAPHVTIKSGRSTVQADRIQMHAVIHNVLVNAIDALGLVPPGRRVLSIALGQKGTDMVLEIDDSGVGVPEDVRDYIFEPLTTTKKDGLGLGLSMCRSIVAAHGGRIQLEDSRLGGARFVITLPVNLV
jgi:two-component system sensor kinase FixL